jgi:RNA recognition motif-containing protein
MSGNEASNSVPLSNAIPGESQVIDSTNSPLNAIASEDAGFEANGQIPISKPHLNQERPFLPPIMPNIPPMHPGGMPVVPTDWVDPNSHNSNNNNLYIKNLSDNVTEEKLRELFSPFGDIVSVKVMRDDMGNSKGFGFVCFSNAPDAHKAKHTMHTQMVEKKPLFVTFAQKKEDRQKQLQQFHSNGFHGSYGMYPPPPFGAPMNFPEFYSRQPILPFSPQPQPPMPYLGMGEYPPQYPPKGNKPQQRRGQYAGPQNGGGRGNPNNQYKNNRNYSKQNRRDYPPSGSEHYNNPSVMMPPPSAFSANDPSPQNDIVPQN